jgi:hypothetical protein
VSARAALWKAIDTLIEPGVESGLTHEQAHRRVDAAIDDLLYTAFKEVKEEMVCLRRLARVLLCQECSGHTGDNVVRTGPCSVCTSPTAFTVTVEQAEAISAPVVG